MNPRFALFVVLPVLLKMHLHLTVGATGTTVSLSLPVLIVAAMVLAVAVLTWLIWRNLRGFRSSPHPRTVY